MGTQHHLSTQMTVKIKTLCSQNFKNPIIMNAKIIIQHFLVSKCKLVLRNKPRTKSQLLSAKKNSRKQKNQEKRGWWWTGKKGKWSQEGLAQTRIAITFRIQSQKYLIVEEGNNTISASQRRFQILHFWYLTKKTKKKKKRQKNIWTDKIKK